MNQDKLLSIAQKALDTDVTPNDSIPDKLDCANTVSTLIKKLFPDFKITPSTIELTSILKKDSRFKATLTPARGCIIISPTQGSVIGHCGIMLSDQRIASNTSFGKYAGMFMGNYDFSSWVQKFKTEMGLHVYLFQVLD